MKQHTFLVIAGAMLLSSLSAKAQPAFVSGDKAIRFTENKGQVSDQYYQPRQDILFSGSLKEMEFYLRRDGISYQLNRTAEKKGERDAERSIYRLDVQWLNTSLQSTIKHGETLTGCDNYYLEHCAEGAVQVKSYASVTYEHLYKGIHLKWYQKEGNLKYDYIVEAGADYSRIRLEIKGAEGITVNRKGELELKTPFGMLIEQAPLVIQNGKRLASKWEIHGQMVSFAIKGVDPSQPFVIDPAIRTWGTYYGGSPNDEGRACSTDTQGNVYMTGVCNTPAILATTGAHQTTFGGGTNAFLVKFNSSGVRQWGTYYGGTTVDEGYSCATDLNGNVFLCGSTTCTTTAVIATAGSHQYGLASPGQHPDAFLVKFNSSGVRQWGTYYGGTGLDIAFSCATDAGGNVYMTGETGSSGGTFIATAGSHQQNLSNSNSTDAFLVKFNAAGVRQWGTYYGDYSGGSVGMSCATDASGNVFMAGMSSTTVNVASSGSHQTTNNGQRDAFLVKFNTTGVRQWGTYYGDAQDEIFVSCAVDASGNVFLSGDTYSVTTPIANAIASAGSYQSSFAGGVADVFLAKFNSGGTRLWGTYYGSAVSEEPHALCVDAVGNAYIAGSAAFNSNSSLTTAGSHQVSFGGGFNDAFLTQFDANGNRIWGTLYGGSGSDKGYGCAAGPASAVYLCGLTTSSGSISTAGSHQSTWGANGDDAFLVQFNDCALPGTPVNATAVSSRTVCQGHSTTLSASSTGSVSWYSSATSTQAVGTNSNFPTPASLGSGNYTYYAGATNACGTSTRTAITFTVRQAPTVSAASGTFCIGQSFNISPFGAVTFTVSGNNNTVTVTNTFTVNPSVTTNYSVTGSNVFGCVSGNVAICSVTPVDCSLLTALSQDQIPAVLPVYPNPNKGEFIVQLPPSGGEWQAELYSVLGVCIYKGKLKEGKHKITMEDHPSGVYFLTLLNNGALVQTTKLVKTE